jgi:hypothetical protein
MEIFKLESELVKFEDGNYNVVVKPQEPISEYVNCSKFVFAFELDQPLIDDFIIEQTPLLFAIFKESESVPDTLKNNFTL